MGGAELGGMGTDLVESRARVAAEVLQSRIEFEAEEGLKHLIKVAWFEDVKQYGWDDEPIALPEYGTGFAGMAGHYALIEIVKRIVQEKQFEYLYDMTTRVLQGELVARGLGLKMGTAPIWGGGFWRAMVYYKLDDQ